jgi:hypothetical protein
VGLPCVPAANDCHTGVTDCSTGLSTCTDTGSAKDGTACTWPFSDLCCGGATCYGGACANCACECAAKETCCVSGGLPACKSSITGKCAAMCL